MSTSTGWNGTPEAVKNRINMRRFIGSFAICVLVCACFTGAIVLAQAEGAAPPQDPAPQLAKKKADLEANLAKAVEARRVQQAKRAVALEADLAKAVEIQRVQGKRAVVRNVQQNRAPLIQQFTTQARPLLRAELIFARNVCHLNREELRKVNQDAQKMLDEIIAQLVDAQFQPRVPLAQLKAKAQKRPVSNLDAQQLLKDGVATVMKQDLTPEQWALYEAERVKREENRKRATIRYFTDAIDRDLYLAQDQRERLEASFKESWDSSWSLYLENHLYGNRYYPMTIDPVVTPILTDAQKKVWQGVQKVGVYWGFAGMLGNFANDADDLAIELGEAARPNPDANPGMRNDLRRVEMKLQLEQMQMQLQQMQAGDVIINAEPAPLRQIPTKVVEKKKAVRAKGQVKAAPATASPAKEVEKTKD